MNGEILSKGTFIGAIIAGIIASIACLGPLILLALGLGGIWAGTFMHLNAIRPYMIGITVLFLVFAFWKLYITPRNRPSDGLCHTQKKLRKKRIIFWFIVIVVTILVAFHPVMDIYFASHPEFLAKVLGKSGVAE